MLPLVFQIAPDVTGCTVAFPRQVSPSGHSWQLSRLGLRIYSPELHSLHSCNSANPSFSIVCAEYPDGQESSKYWLLFAS